MKKHILEALGVPENILLSGEKLYKDLLKQLSYESNETFDEDTKFEITFNTNLQVNELNIRKVHVQIELDFVNTDKILMAGMGYSPRFTHNVKKFVSMSLQDFSELYMKLIFLNSMLVRLIFLFSLNSFANSSKLLKSFGFFSIW